MTKNDWTNCAVILGKCWKVFGQQLQCKIVIITARDLGLLNTKYCVFSLAKVNVKLIFGTIIQEKKETHTVGCTVILIQRADIKTLQEKKNHPFHGDVSASQLPMCALSHCAPQLPKNSECQFAESIKTSQLIPLGMLCSPDSARSRVLDFVLAMHLHNRIYLQKDRKPHRNQRIMFI